MRKILSSIDIGNSSIKLVVGEEVNGRLNILCASKVDTKGYKDSKVTDKDSLIDSIKKCVEEASKTIGLPIKKVVLGLNSNGIKLAKSACYIDIDHEDTNITGDEISTVIQKAAEGKVMEDKALVGVIPVEFVLDEDKFTTDPKLFTSSHLGIRAIVASCDKEYITELLNVLTLAGLKVVDVVLNALGDYYAFESSETKLANGAIINLGHDTTTISVFNRGVIVNSKTYKAGGSNIIKDIGFVNKLDDDCSLAIYKDLALANTRLANPKEYRIVTNLDGEEIKVNQYDTSELACTRLNEILNLTKKQINILTKREISYIIVTGGLTEMRDFSITLEDSFGKNVYLGRVNMIGARDNAFSSGIGVLKYFNQKLKLKGKNFSIFNDDDIEEMNNRGKSSNGIGTSLLSKVFGYFFDN